MQPVLYSRKFFVRLIRTGTVSHIIEPLLSESNRQLVRHELHADRASMLTGRPRYLNSTTLTEVIGFPT